MSGLSYGALGMASFAAASPLRAGREKPAESRKLNFVFILIDDMGAVDAGCCGSTFYETPNLDKLATQGMRFTQAYAASCVCSATRASIMTGKDPAKLRITNFVGHHHLKNVKMMTPSFELRIPHDEVVIANALKPAGYTSASIGKWHLGPKTYYPQDHGFDLNVGGTESGMPCSHFYPQWGSNPPIKGRDGEYLTDRLTEEAEKFMEANKDKPFFLYLSHYAVHIPLEAKKAIIDKYRSRIKPGQLQNNPLYAGMIEGIDDSVGRVMRKLDELGIADRTVVIFTSDNGGLSVPEWGGAPATSNAPFRGGKGQMYEGGTREPLIVRWPGVVEADSLCDTPVSSIDFYPTMLEIAGCEIPRSRGVDGVSLVQLLKQSGKLSRDTLYWHYPHYSNQQGAPGSAIRHGDYKLIQFYEDGHLELYDLAQDIGEENNLVAAMPEKAASLSKMLNDYLDSIDAQMPWPNPDYVPPDK